MLVKNGAIIAISNKYGDTPLSKARPRLRKKLEALAGEFGQSLVIVPHKSESTLCLERDYYTKNSLDFYRIYLSLLQK